MVTGHREIEHADLVADRLCAVLTKLAANVDAGELVAVSGGAQGADTLFATAAVRAGVPYDLMLPNRWYRSWYPAAVSDEIVAGARHVTFVVERPDVADWRQQWKAQRWFVDNFVRNAAMIDRSGTHVVVSPRHPAALASEDRGGTAHAVREMARRSLRVVWVPDRPDIDVVWVPLTPRQPTSEQLALL